MSGISARIANKMSRFAGFAVLQFFLFAAGVTRSGTAHTILPVLLPIDLTAICRAVSGNGFP
jgi:hypothetical protein